MAVEPHRIGDQRKKSIYAENFGQVLQILF